MKERPKEEKKEMCLIISSVFGILYLGSWLLCTHDNIVRNEKTGYQWIKYWFTNINRITNKVNVIVRAIRFLLNVLKIPKIIFQKNNMNNI